MQTFKSILLSVSILFSSSALPEIKDAKNHQYSYTRWNYGPLLKKKNFDGSISETKHLTRKVLLKGNLINVGSITYNKIPLSALGKTNIDKLNKHIKQAMGLTTWHKTQDVNGATIKHGFSKDFNREISLATRVQNKEMTFVFSSYRKGYARLIQKEFTYLERLFLFSPRTKKKTGKTDINFLKHIINEAHADNDIFSSLQIPPGILPPVDQFGNLGDIFTIQTNSTIDVNLNGMDAVTNFGGDLITSTDTIHSSSDILANGAIVSSQNISNGLVTASNGMVTASNNGVIMSENGVKMSENALQAADKISDAITVTPEESAQIAAGAVVGAFTANLLLSGIQMGIAGFWDWLTEESEDKDRFKKFMNAKKNWQEVNQAALQLEQTIDHLLSAQDKLGMAIDLLAKAEGKDPATYLTREKIIHAVETRKALAENNLIRLNKSIAEMERCEYERKANALASQKANFQNFITSTESFVKVIKKDRSFRIFDKEEFCQKLGDVLGKLSMIEKTIQDHRLNLILGAGTWMKAEKEELEESSKRASDFLEHREEFMDEQIELAEEIYDIEKRQIKNAKGERSWTRNCRKKGSLQSEFKDELWEDYTDEIRSMVISNIFRTRKTKRTPYDKLKKKQQEKVDRNLAKIQKNNRRSCFYYYHSVVKPELNEDLKSAKADLEKSLQSAKKDYEESVRRGLNINTETLKNNYKAYAKWLKDLELEQDCINNLDEMKNCGNNKKSQKCRLYKKKTKRSCEGMQSNNIVRLFETKVKAQEKIKSDCPELTASGVSLP